MSGAVDAPRVALRLEGVERRFGALLALRGVDLNIAEGERRAIIGANGAGKTTLFNVIAGDFKPTSGSIFLFDEDITDLAPQLRTRRGVSRTYQNSLLFTGLSVADSLYLAVRGTRRNRLSLVRPGHADEQRAQAEQAATTVGLSPLLGARVSELSHGQQRQLELAMALAGAPRVILLVEPAAGLSRTERVSLTELLARLPRDITLIFIEHDMEVALQAAEQVTVLHNGEIVSEGTPTEVENDQTVQQIYLGERRA